jgi:HD-GYP domain-containing protein (c-di-GMP phosphodiesterase class II)
MLLAPQLVGEARARRQRKMDRRERVVEVTSALLFLAAAGLIAVFVSSSRDADPLLMAGLVVGYAAVSRVRFEYSDAYVSAEQLVFIPMLVLLPLEYVPLLVCAAGLLSSLPEILAGTWHPQRAIPIVSESWFAIGPVLVLTVFAPGDTTSADWELYLAAFAAEVVFDIGGSLIRETMRTRTPFAEFVGSSLGTVQIDAILTPVAFVIALEGINTPLTLLVIGPLVWLLKVFSRERRERYSATLELNRAYRGTVMLLADVVESEDGYTGEHSRSVVELVQAVTDHLGVDPGTRQEMEFAALLHDVGKISIPKEILNKPAKLTAEEFELMKTHTVEGQFLLDRVGGLLGRIGEVVRSCHERWDGQGYPDGIAGEKIPLAARIVFVCDAYNAMTTDRPYRQAMSTEAALQELKTNAGTQFDPTIVTALVEVIQDAEPESRAADDMRLLLSEVRLGEQMGTAI